MKRICFSYKFDLDRTQASNSVFVSAGDIVSFQIKENISEIGDQPPLRVYTHD